MTAGRHVSGPAGRDVTMTPLFDAQVGEEADTTSALAALASRDWRDMADEAAARRDRIWGNRVTYSRKVFIPLTHLCRDVCHYCTFAVSPKKAQRPFLSLDEVEQIARAGAEAGCREALFTLGDRPEARYAAARTALAQSGHASTVAYLADAAKHVLTATGLLPHINAGILNASEYAQLRPLAPSFGLMLETTSERLSQRGGPHFGSPDKHPAIRLEALRLAGEAHIPTTTGLLVGIGETRAERIDALLAIAKLHRRHGHIQEIIIQNFRAKPDTKMANAPEPSMDEFCWTIAAARLLLPDTISIQAPPNLARGELIPLIQAGINDWGGVSPVTPDFVNPEAPWPHLDRLAEETARAGKVLVERLTVYPNYIHARERWIAPELHRAVLAHSDCGGLARTGAWTAGGQAPFVWDKSPAASSVPSAATIEIVAKAAAGERLDRAEIVHLFQARGADLELVTREADRLRRETNGDTITYAVNRNINYTNVCIYRCGFCAFSKGRVAKELRSAPYLVELPELQRRVREAWARGATEVCLQGGIHPDYTGKTYLEICEAAKDAVPDIHIHAFSPLEIWHGAHSLGLGLSEFLRDLKNAGLGSLPGTAAEILDDDVRAIICPDKINTAQWLEVIGAAHRLGLPTTSTIMFGHVETYGHWATHLLRIRDLQVETGGFTEFVPLSYVHEEAPMHRRNGTRRGPSEREAVLMHAVSRLVFHRQIANIQASWVKLGREGVLRCLQSGANDIGGTLMNESISRAAGATHGQELSPAEIAALAGTIGRPVRQRTTLYKTAPQDRVALSFAAPPLEPVAMTSAARVRRERQATPAG